VGSPGHDQPFCRLYATTKPATIQWGNALDTSAIAFPGAKAVAILRAITGNLNVPGGEMFLTPAPFLRPGKFFLLSKFPRDREMAWAGSLSWHCGQRLCHLTLS